MANIVLITHGTGGDVKPFIKLGKRLKIMGHQVRLVTHYIYEEESRRNELEFAAIDTYEEYLDRNNNLGCLSDAIKESKEYIEFNKKYYGADRTYKEFLILSKYCNNSDTIIIFRHRFSLAGLLVAEKYKLPVASVFLAPNYIQHLELHEGLIGDIMKNEINIVRKKIELNPIDNWTEWMCSPQLKLALWPQWYAKEEVDNIDGTKAIGFPEIDSENLDEIPKEVKELLKNKKKTILITAGTSRAINNNFYKISIEASNKIESNVIVVTSFDEFLPNKLGSNILRLREAPIKKIMPYVDVVVHHGGIGTASEALYSGTPQLILAHLADRPDNANRLKKLGVAKVLPEKKWKIDHIENTLREILYRNELMISCKKISCELNIYNINQELALIMSDFIEHRERYVIDYSYKSNNNILINKKNSEKNKLQNKEILDTITDKKKQMMLKLLREKVKK